MTSVMVSSLRNGSIGPKPVTSWIIWSTSFCALLARDRQVALGDHPVDDPLHLGGDVLGVRIHEVAERGDDLALQLQPDVPDLLATPGAARGCRRGRRDGDQSAVGRIARPSLRPFDPFQQRHRQFLPSR